MQPEKQLGLESGYSRKPFVPSNEQMFKSIKDSMESLVEEVSGMAEILEALQQELMQGSTKEMT